MKTLDAERLRPLAAPAYAVSLLLILIPWIDTVLSVWPPRLGDVSWRFGAVGLGSQAIMTPLLGGLLALAIAVVLEHRRVIRVVQVLAWVVAAKCVLAIGLFLLDAAQMRGNVRDAAQGMFDKASLVALAKYLFGAIVSVMFARAAGRLYRHTAAAHD